jgi:DNA-binding CsgD family transcriptional regulator
VEKEVFIHLIIEGLTVKETAEIMNVNINRIYYLKKEMEKSLKVIFQK